MILSKKIKVKINPSNYKHYAKHYEDIKIKDVLYVNLIHLTKGCNSLLDVKCDICGIDKKILARIYRGKRVLINIHSNIVF